MWARIASIAALHRAPRRPFLIGVACGIVLVIGLTALVNATTVVDFVVAPLLIPDTPGPADAIVVAGAGVIGACEPNRNAIQRVLLAARLWRQGRAPVLVFTGGTPGFGCAVGNAMASLARDVGVPGDRIRVEARSRSTRENAEFGGSMLRQLGASRILLVTDKLHMPRAAGVFARLGFIVERAAVPGYAGHADNVGMLAAGLREYAAIAYYWSRGWLPSEGVLNAAPLPLRASSDEHPVAAPHRFDRTGVSDTTRTQIVLLGASYAAGWKLNPIQGLSVVNKGVAGQQSSELLQRFDADVVSLRPRAVIIWGFINDLFRTAPEQADQTIAAAKEHIEAMVASARRAGIEPILATEVTIRPVDSWSEAVGSWLGWALGKEGHQDRINRHVLTLNAWMHEFARREGLLLLDLQPVVAGSGGRRRPEFATPDGSHIPPAGYDALTAYARPILEAHFARQ